MMDERTIGTEFRGYETVSVRLTCPLLMFQYLRNGGSMRVHFLPTKTVLSAALQPPENPPFILLTLFSVALCFSVCSYQEVKTTWSQQSSPMGEFWNTERTD